MISRVLQKIAHGLLRRWRALTHITAFVLPEERVGREIKRCLVVEPAQRVRLGSIEEDPFIPIGKYYRDGFFERGDVFVAEVPNARLHVGSGLVCAPGFKALADADALDRMDCFSAFGGPKPRRWTRLPGRHSTLHYCYADNFWHWMIDCLPKVISLERALGSRELTIVMPETATAIQRESMQAFLPKNFSVIYFPPETWVESETFFWPSLASGRCNAFLPPGYFDEIRGRIFAHYGLSQPGPSRRRLYVSRHRARHRRILNETAVERLLKEFSVETVEPEDLTFRQQVELFREASLVIGGHGAGLASTVFSGPIPLLVFYATPTPPNYFHTQACALGQKHRFLLHSGTHEDDDFSVDLRELRGLLEKETSSL